MQPCRAGPGGNNSGNNGSNNSTVAGRSGGQAVPRAPTRRSMLLPAAAGEQVGRWGWEAGWGWLGIKIGKGSNPAVPKQQYATAGRHMVPRQADDSNRRRCTAKQALKTVAYLVCKVILKHVLPIVHPAREWRVWVGGELRAKARLCCPPAAGHARQTRWPPSCPAAQCCCQYSKHRH